MKQIGKILKLLRVIREKSVKDFSEEIETVISEEGSDQI